MWAYSAKFRQQCQPLALARELVVVLLVNTTDKRSTAHASTEMSRKNGVLTLARVIIRRPDESVELIAHDIEHEIEHVIEHVIEQLDGVALGDRADARSTHEAGPPTSPVGRERPEGSSPVNFVKAGVASCPQCPDTIHQRAQSIPHLRMSAPMDDSWCSRRWRA